MKSKTILCCLLLTSMLTGPASQTQAQDFSQWSARGDVAVVDLYFNTSGQYEFTKLWVYVNGFDDPGRDNPYIVNCDGDQIADCKYPTAFLGQAGCSPITHESFPVPFFLGYPIDKNLTLERYRCPTGSRKDAGACVTLSGDLINVFTQSTANQVLWPWVTAIDWWTGGCTSKP